MACPPLSHEDIIEALRSTGGAKAAAACLLGISPRTLQRRLDQMESVSLEPELSPVEEMNQRITMDLIEKALEGDVKCQIFYLKSIGWGRELVVPVLWQGYPQY